MFWIGWWGSLLDFSGHLLNLDLHSRWRTKDVAGAIAGLAVPKPASPAERNAFNAVYSWEVAAFVTGLFAGCILADWLAT